MIQTNIFYFADKYPDFVRPILKSRINEVTVKEKFHNLKYSSLKIITKSFKGPDQLGKVTEIIF